MNKIKMILPIVTRVLMGMLFVFSGLNGFFHFVLAPENGMPEGALALSTAMMNSGYMMQLVFITQLLAGLSFLSGFFIPLALTILAPVVINIVAFHIFLAPAGTGMAIFVAIMELYLAYTYRAAFASILRPKATAS